MIDISPIQIAIVLVIALLVFGPKRLPRFGRDIGRGLREFKNSVSDFSFDEQDSSTRRPASQTAAEEADAPSALEPTTEAVDPDEDLEGIVVPGDAPPR